MSTITTPPKDARDMLQAHGAPGLRDALAPVPITASRKPPPDEDPPITFLSPSTIAAWDPPPGFVLSDYHLLVRGNFVTLAGHGGVGKSRAALALAIAGALPDNGRERQWMGIRLHERFRTLILQAENGMFRLQSELAEAGIGEDFDEWITVTSPPQHGLDFSGEGFRHALKSKIEDFNPSVLVVDPWNEVAADDTQADYKRALTYIRSCLPSDPERQPLSLISAHLRKPKGDGARKHGRDLMHELAGSHKLASASRAVMMLEAGSPESDDDRVVFTVCKNNDGDLPRSSAWHRRNGLFAPCEDFDWDAWKDGGDRKNGAKVTAEDIDHALEGEEPMTKADAARRIMEWADCGRSAAFDALKRFPDLVQTVTVNGKEMIRHRAADAP